MFPGVIPMLYLIVIENLTDENYWHDQTHSDLIDYECDSDELI